MGGCPFHSSNDEQERQTDTPPDEEEEAPQRGYSVQRREVVKSALLIGGASAVTTLGSIAGITPTVRAAESDSITARARDNRQHAWDAYEASASSGHSVHPAHSLILGLNLKSDGTPAPGHRRQVATALNEIENHFEWNNEGVLFTMAYSTEYFDRFDGDLPDGANPTPPQQLEEYAEQYTTDDDLEGDTHDAVLLLASENEANLLAVEAALWGRDNDLDISVDATFEGVFERPTEFPDRRVGFGGAAFQEKGDQYEEIVEEMPDYVDEEAPLSMGFIAGFDTSIPSEDDITLVRDQQFPAPGVDKNDVSDELLDRDYIDREEFGSTRDPGVFAQGTLQHLSHVRIDLEEWYGNNSLSERRHSMYSPYHTEEETGTVGGGLTRDHAPHDPDDSEDPGAEQKEANDGVPDLKMRDPDERDLAETTQQTAKDGTALTDYDGEGDSVPTVAHGQKCARARIDVDGDGDREQIVLRRDWDNLAAVDEDDEPDPGYHFNSPMRFNEYIINLLEAMHFVEFESLDGAIKHEGVENLEAVENGIAEYMNATYRGNFLIPPITLRALPYPQADTAHISVTKESDTYVVEVSDVEAGGGRIDPDTVRFGAPTTVNKAGGAEPTAVSRRGGTVIFEFPASEVSDSLEEAKLFGKKQGTRKPIAVTSNVSE